MISERRRIKIKIIINEVPLSKNKYVNMHWASRMKYRNDIAWLLCKKRVLKRTFYEATVTFNIYFKTNRKRDIQNYLGGGLIAWLDELVDQDL